MDTINTPQVENNNLGAKLEIGSQEWIDTVFAGGRPLSETETVGYKEIYASAKNFALTITKHTPKSADQSVALRKVREATFTAVGAIALKGIA